MSDQPQGVTFTAFVMSLATTAAVHFGDLPDPSGGETRTDLQSARQMIDILTMLKDKTRGNLSDDEARLVEELLYDLRLRFVEAVKNEKRIITP
jgi:Domain of unknown function (DUF1844)